MRVTLRGRFVLVFMTFSLVVTAAVGFVSWWIARDALELELDERLVEVAGAAAETGLQSSLVLALEPGEEDLSAWGSTHEMLRRLRRFVDGAYIVDAQGQALVTHAPADSIPIGTPLRFLEPHAAELVSARTIGRRGATDRRSAASRRKRRRRPCHLWLASRGQDGPDPGGRGRGGEAAATGAGAGRWSEGRGGQIARAQAERALLQTREIRDRGVTGLRFLFRRAYCSRGWLTLVAVAMVLSFAVPGAAQQSGDQVVDRELVYRSAQSQHQAALDAWGVVEKQWNDAVEEHAQARSAADDQRKDAALVRALDLAQELDRLERRVMDQRGVLDIARTGLLAALDDRIERLSEQLGATPAPAERTRLATFIRDLENEAAELEGAAAGPAVQLELVYYPSIQFDPRGTPRTLGYKAELLRSKAEQSDSAMAHIDREIQRFERQLRRSRNVQSLVTGVERFGDIQVPVGAPNRSTPRGTAQTRPDSTGVARPKMTPQQLIEKLQLLRIQVEAAKRQFLERAGAFEVLVRRQG